MQEFLKQGYLLLHRIDTLLNLSDIDIGTKPRAPERIAALSFEHHELTEKIRLQKVV